MTGEELVEEKSVSRKMTTLADIKEKYIWETAQ